MAEKNKKDQKSKSEPKTEIRISKDTIVYDSCQNQPRSFSQEHFVEDD